MPGVDLARFAILHPELDAENKLLTLWLDHGKANEMGTAQLDAFDALCETLEADASVMCLCTSSRRESSSGKANRLHKTGERSHSAAFSSISMSRVTAGGGRGRVSVPGDSVR